MRQHRRRTAFVLLAALWVMVGVSALGLGLVLVARRAAGAARNRRSATVAMWNAEDCLARTQAIIADVLARPPAGGEPGVGSGATTWATLDRAVSSAASVDNARCSATLAPTGTAVDVNTADRKLLIPLVQALGVTPGRTDSMVDALLDWRDADEVPRAHGAEGAWYMTRGRVVPRNGPFADARELNRVRGFERFHGLDSLFGVDSDRIVLDRAPIAVIASLPGFSGEAIARLAEHRARGVPIRDLLSFSTELSPNARAVFIGHYPDLVRLTTAEPDAWVVRARGVAGSPRVTAVIEVRLNRAGARAAIVRRRTWIE